ncbi:MAG: S8 family serine peptidase [Saprospiraceae bacterium]|nr:S8 family serine peptidase [Saprospiraceae bacterium]
MNYTIAQPLQASPTHLSPALQSRQHQPATDHIQVSIVASDPNALLFEIQQLIPSARLLGAYMPAGVMMVSLPENEFFDKISSHPLLQFADLANTAPQTETLLRGHNLHLNKVNTIHNAYPLIDGRGMVVSVKENRYDSADIDLKGRHRPSNLGSNFVEQHATAMATTLAGAGNIWYADKGAAPGATITPSSFEVLLPDPDEAYESLHVSVQNHSYGAGFGNYYDPGALAYDWSSVQTPSLLRVFSAGNRGSQADTTGNYAGITGYANLTGHFKMAKNVLLVGALDTLGATSPLSSRGPAYDGRLKPELVALGHEGSSNAAALVSGIALLVQQAYRDTQQGQLPESALVKAILCNSAEDAGPPGIDYITGFGNVNALQAVQTTLENRWFSGEISDQEQLNLPLDIPANATNLKITLAWIDPPAIPTASNALINDLDLTLAAPVGVSWQPWTLSAYPHADSLALPARRNRDSRNNIEQITLDNPAPGEYDIIIAGHAVAQGPQRFSVAYQWDTLKHFAWTYPSRSDRLISGYRIPLRWETTLVDAPVTLAYRHLADTEWTTLTDTLAPSEQVWWWTPPPSFAGPAILRLSAGNRHFLSDTFGISPVPEMRLALNCADSIALSWQPVAGAEAYALYYLGDQYMTPLTTLADTLITLDKALYNYEYYSVAPVLYPGIEGPRSYSVDAGEQAGACYVNNFLAYLLDSRTILQFDLSTTYGVSHIAFEKIENGAYIELFRDSPGASLTFSHTDEQPHQGINTYRARVDLHSGTQLYSDPIDIYYTAGQPAVVFPNPASASESLQVIFGPDEISTFVLFDAQGRRLLTFVPSEELHTLQINPLSPGVYFYGVLAQKRWQGGQIVVY